VSVKLCIIGGGGTVGSSAAFRISSLGLVDEIVLLDARRNMAESHAMDLDQAAGSLGGCAVGAGDWEDLAGADIVILSAGMPERNVASRDEYLAGNLEIVKEAAGHIAARCPEAVVLVATNPIDVFTAAVVELTGTERRRVIGYSWNDTLRLRWAVARVLGEPAADVDALVIGEHGESQVPLYDRITVRGLPVVLSPEQQEAADAAVRGWFSSYQGLNSGRTSGWTSAVGLATMVGAIVGNGPDVLPGSVVLHGEYGVRGVSLGVPLRLGRRGADEIIQLPLTAAQQAAFEAAASKVGGHLKDILGGTSEALQ
jgi:malate dehydrogenase